MILTNNKLVSPFELSLLFLLFLLVSGNYLENLFPCKIQRFLVDNMYFKHLLGMLTLIFFIVLVNKASGGKNIILKDIIKISIKLYILFILLTNNQKRFFIASIVILCLLYIIQIYKNELDKNTKKYMYVSNLEKGLYYCFIIILVIGFTIYLGAKKLEYGREFNYLTFLLGRPECRGVSRSTSYWESFKAAFKKTPDTIPFHADASDLIKSRKSLFRRLQRIENKVFGKSL